jgi:CBS domain-containing protein
MSKDVEVVGPEATLIEAAEKMRALNVGALPVCAGDDLVGMVTDRDIVVRGLAVGKDAKATPVSEVMTERIEWLLESCEVREAADLMERKQIRRIAVLDEDNKLVGIVALGDLALEASDRKLKGEILERVSEPSIPTY